MNSILDEIAKYAPVCRKTLFEEDWLKAEDRDNYMYDTEYFYMFGRHAYTEKDEPFRQRLKEQIRNKKC
jgi:hypothetical protein